MQQKVAADALSMDGLEGSPTIGGCLVVRVELRSQIMVLSSTDFVIRVGLWARCYSNLQGLTTKTGNLALITKIQTFWRDPKHFTAGSSDWTT